MNKSNPFISVDYWLTRADVIIDSNCKNKLLTGYIKIKLDDLSETLL